MGIEIQRLPRPGDQPAAVVVAEQRLWLTADKEHIVGEGDRRAAFLLCSPGDELPLAVAERYGLIAAEAEPEPEPEPDVAEKAAGPAEDKQADKQADKKRRLRRSKSKE